MDFAVGGIESLDSITICELLKSSKEIWQTKLKMIRVMSYYLPYWEICR
jgi:hypothetical protein